MGLIKTTAFKTMFIAHMARMAAAALLPVATLPYVSRGLGPSALGAHQFVNSFVMYFVALGAMGIPVFGQREAAATRSNQLELARRVSNLYGLSLGVAFVVYAGLLATALAVPALQTWWSLVAIAGLAVPAGALAGEWVLFALDDFVFVSVRQFLFQLLSALAMVFWIKSPSDLGLYAFLVIVPQVAAAVFNASRILPLLNLSALSKSQMVHDFRGALVLFLSTLATMVYTNLDSVALGFWHPSSEVGEYGLAKRLLQASTSAATAFGVLMISRASSSHAQNDSAQFSRLVLWSFRFLLLIALPMALGMGLIRHELALFFGGPAFAETATALALVAPNIFFVAIGYLALIQILIPRGLEKRALVCWSLGGAWAALMVPLLVPKWGLVGAGVVCLTSEALVATLAVWFTRRELVAGLHGDELLIAALACCAMVAAVLLTQRYLDTSEYQPLSRLVALLATGSTAYLGTVGVGWCGLSFVLKRHPA